MIVPQLDATQLASRIDSASESLKGRVVHTPTVRLPWLDRPGQQVWAKLEGQQHTQSFKYRGAFHAVERCPTRAVITASAGNHALAICRAAKALSKEAHIIAPSNVSEIKAKRILAEAESVTFYGKDLREATLQAMARSKSSKNGISKESRADTREMTFISPYCAPDVAAGAGTMMREAFDDEGSFDQVVVPLGGGGLAAAVAAWCSANSPQTQVICTHPKVFGRTMTANGRVSTLLTQPTEASFCDGLAVQLAEPTPFADILDSMIQQVVQVSEHDVALGIAQALKFQSLLIEGSAATTIAALPSVQSAQNSPKPRKVLLLLTGSNIASSSVARALVAEVSDGDQRQQLGLRAIASPTEKFGSLAGLTECQALSTTGTTPDTRDKAWSSTQTLQALTLRLADQFKCQMGQESQRRGLCTQLNLASDDWSLQVFDDLAALTNSALVELSQNLHDTQSSSLPIWAAEERYRTVLQLHASMVNLNKRASAANDQSALAWFHDSAQQSSAACNYDRYGDQDTRAAELDLLRTFRIASDHPVSLLLTSSGMAAYHVVQQYILQQLNYGDTIVLPPYIYFEAAEQLQRFGKMVSLRYAPSFHHDDIIRTAEEHDARVVFIDPMANVVGLPTTDLKVFGEKVSARHGWRNRFVVIDGTVVSGALPVFDWFTGPQAPTVLYTESFSKYTQLGLDYQMAGGVFCPANLDAELRKIRRDTGGILYPRSVPLFPILNHEQYQARLQHLSWNAENFATHVGQHASHLVEVRFPAEWRKLGWRHGGALVTLEFREGGLNNREGLDACIELVLGLSRRASLPVTKGVSFGFSAARISASSSMAEGSDPFLRVSVGIDHDQTMTLASIVVQAVSRYCQIYSAGVDRTSPPQANL